MMRKTDSTIRAMRSGDLERVISLDAQASGLKRDDFFRRRWQAMEGNPRRYFALVAGVGDSVDGFVMGHVLTGEFGATRRLAIIDGIAVDPEVRRGGVGGSLMDAFKGAARERECLEVRTLADWDRQDLVGFFAGNGFSLAPLNALEKNLEAS